MIPDVGQIWRCKITGSTAIVERVLFEPGRRPLVRVYEPAAKCRYDEERTAFASDREYVGEHIEIET